MKNPYTILGVAKSAAQADIKTAYRKLARQFHPDTRPGDRLAEDRFKDISSAYDLIGDATRRHKFDSGEINADGHRNAAPGFGGRARQANPKSGKSRFEGFFKDRARRASSMKARGADVTYTLTVPFLEAAQGMDKSVRMTQGKTLKVKVPAGTEEGTVLRLKGQGMTGIGGGLAGDALVEISIAPDPEFRSEGLDIHIDVPVTLDEAILGGRIEATTIHGIVAMGVPEGSNTGTQLRLKGRGIHAAGGHKGDQYVTLKVVLPRQIDGELKTFVKKWSAKKPYSVRAASKITKKPAAAAE